MSYRTAQILGALLAVLLVGGVVFMSRALPPACHGALRIELRPPLKGNAPFQFSIETGAATGAEPQRHCEFDVQLTSKADVIRKECVHPWQLQLRGSPGELAITGLLLGATPTQLRLRVKSNDEALYDSVLEPSYAGNIAALRPDGGEERFCGAAALLKPDCVRGSSQCVPFNALCDGPEDCPHGQVCCAAPAWGMEYGARNAMECSSRAQCNARIESYVACHADSECEANSTCEPSTVGQAFKPVLEVCSPRPSKTGQ